MGLTPTGLNGEDHLEGEVVLLNRHVLVLQTGSCTALSVQQWRTVPLVWYATKPTLVRLQAVLPPSSSAPQLLFFCQFLLHFLNSHAHPLVSPSLIFPPLSEHLSPPP